jgi:hypothetical protein
VIIENSMGNKKKLIPQFWIPKEYPEGHEINNTSLVEGHRKN